jgi:hypothetical protein
MKPDRRYNPPQIHQTVIVDIVRAALEERLPEPLEEVRARAEAERAEILALLARAGY